MVETQGDVEKVKDDLEKAKDVQARMEGKVEDMKVELVDCVETRCKRQDGLLMEQGERKYAPSRQIVTRWGRCH